MGRVALVVFSLGLVQALGCDAGQTSEDPFGMGGAGAAGVTTSPSATHSAATGSTTATTGTATTSSANTTAATGSSTTGTTTATVGSGSSTTATASASSVSAASSSASGGPGAACNDGIQNGNETGVDCGGSCLLPCTAYKNNAPNTNGVTSACDSNGSDFICPRFMLFSSEMEQAAADDEKANNWPAGAFNYGVATLNGSPACSCWQIVYDSLPSYITANAPPPKPLIIQTFNTGGANNAFDVFMGKGGEGSQTAGCARLYSSYPSTGEPNGGGIKATTTSQCTSNATAISSDACVMAVEQACKGIQADSDYVAKTTQNSCIEANSADSLYHENWNVKARQVTCPSALTDVTGCKPSQGGPNTVDATVTTAAEASSWSSYTTTTMEDCCVPSYAFPNNVNVPTQNGYKAFYACNKAGMPQ